MVYYWLHKEPINLDINMPGTIQTLPVPPPVSELTMLNAIRLAVAGGGGSAPNTLDYTSTLNPVLADGFNRQVTMTGNVTLNGPTGGSNGSLWQIRLIASGGSRTITLGADIVTPTGTTFSGSVASGSARLLQMMYNGNKWWVVRNQEFTA